MEDEHGKVAISGLPFAYEYEAKDVFDDPEINTPEDILKAQIKNVIDEGLLNSNLHDIECRFIKVSGSTYHLYKKNDGTYYFSMIAPDEWTIKDEFIKSYLYDYDKCFKML